MKIYRPLKLTKYSDVTAFIIQKWHDFLESSINRSCRCHEKLYLSSFIVKIKGFSTDVLSLKGDRFIVNDLRSHDSETEDLIQCSEVFP